MSCLDPILAVSICKNEENKHVLKFLPAKEIEDIDLKKWVYGSDEVFLLPCMKCKPCRDAYAKDWGVRCTLEAQMHKFNYFLTLTYDDAHVFHGGKSDFTSFLKKLGYELNGKPNRPKFFGCMEKGELTGRLHFHCVLFLDHPLVLKNPAKLGSFYHYSCDLLDRCWGNGFVDVAEFESDCARYVAKYATKQGNCFMSRNLAKEYYLKNRDQIVKDDFKVYGSFFGKEYVNIPKCFVRWFVEDHVSEIDNFSLNLKKIQKLAVLSELHTAGYSKESELIRDKILLFLKHDKYAKERSEL